MFNSSAVAGIGSAHQSVADYLVTAIKPDLQVVREKVKGLILEKRIYSLFPGSEVPGLQSYLDRYERRLAESIAESPPWFDVEVYVAKQTEEMLEFISHDKELKHALKNFEKDENIEKKEAADSFSQLTSLLAQRLGNSFHECEQSNAYMMLVSDVPSEYFLLESSMARNELLSLNIFSHRSRRLESELAVQRDFSMWKRAAEKFKKQLSPLMVADRVASDIDSKLELYLRMASSDNMEELFRNRPLAMKRVDKDRLRAELEEFGNALFASGREANALMRNDSLLTKKLGPYLEIPLSVSAKELQASLALAVVG